MRASELVTPQIMGSVNEHRATIDMKHPRDFIDRFLIHGIKEENKGNCGHVFTGRCIYIDNCYVEFIIKIINEINGGIN